MTDENSENGSKENEDKGSGNIRMTLGTVASRFLDRVPAVERVAMLDAAIVRMQEQSSVLAVPQGLAEILDGKLSPLLKKSDCLDRRLDLQEQRFAVLTEAHLKVHHLLDELNLSFQKSLHLVLEECRHTRALIGTELIEGDEREMLIARLEAVTDTREATANAIAEQLSITITHRRRALEQGMENLTPVVVDAKDPEQETELSHSRSGGVER